MGKLLLSIGIDTYSSKGVLCRPSITPNPKKKRSITRCIPFQKSLSDFKENIAAIGGFEKVDDQSYRYSFIEVYTC